MDDISVVARAGTLRTLHGLPDQLVGEVTDPMDDVGTHDRTQARAAPVGSGYRDSLANERTFLAWTRTALSLIAGAVALVKLVPPFAVPAARPVLGLVLAASGLVLPVVAYRRWAANERAMHLELPLPRSTALLWVSALIVLVGLAVLVLTITDGLA